MKHLIRVVALLMTVGPVIARSTASQTPPRTFVLTKDGACSITSSNLREQMSYAGTHMFITRTTPYDIVWSAKWNITGCELPIFVAATFDYLNTKNEVVATKWWWLKASTEEYFARGDLRQITYRVHSVRLTKLQLLTEAQYNGMMLKMAAEKAATHQKP
jgi:hypothetical protein